MIRSGLWMEPAHTLFWGIAASGVGIFIGVLQSTDVIALVLGLAALGVGAAITPLAALLTLLNLAPLRALMATEIPGQLPLDIGQLALIGFLFWYAAWRAVQRQALINLRWTPFYLPLGIFTAIVGLTAFSAISLEAWMGEWLKWLQMLLVVAVALSLIRGREWQWLVFGLVLAATANALVGLYEFLGGSGALHLVINDRFFRAFGTFGQPNPFGGFMGLVLPVALMSALGYGLRLWRELRRGSGYEWKTGTPVVFYAVASGILLGGLLVSWSRGAWLGFAASICAVALALPRNSWRSVASLTLVVVMVVALLTFRFLPQSIHARIISTTEEYFTFSDVRGVKITSENYPVVERLAHWQAAVSMASSNLWLGVGQGNYEIVYPGYRLLNWHYPLGHAHNYYLNILAEAGIIGLLGYGKVLLGIMWLSWRLRAHPDLQARLVAIGLIGSWVYLSIHSLFDNLYVNNLFIHIGLMLGLLAVLYNQAWNHRKVEL